MMSTSPSFPPRPGSQLSIVRLRFCLVQSEQKRNHLVQQEVYMHFHLKQRYESVDQEGPTGDEISAT